MFPWQSGSEGSEETQVVHLNPLSGEWGDDYSSLQRHVSLSIAFNIFQYYNFTGDLNFIEEFGAEIFLEICRFWASKAIFNQQTRRYDIDGVMGPNEYHEAYPESKTGGIKNNAYTNVMTVWVFNHAFIILNLLTQSIRTNLLKKINLSDNELTEWRDISNNLNVPLSDNNVLEQYEGYFNLKELNWKSYREKYENISRMDRILKAEGKSPNDYKVTKQADTLMVFYNLYKDEVHRLLRKTGLSPEDNLLEDNFKYYMNQTSHGSTLSKMVHSNIALQVGNNQLSYDLFFQALQSDYQDVQGGTTKEGIHTGVMASSAFLVLKNYAGLRFDKENIFINPQLPDGWRELVFNINYRGNKYNFKLTDQKIKITHTTHGAIPGVIYLKNKKISFNKSSCAEIDF